MHERDAQSGAPPAPAAALTVFGERLGLAERFVALLAESGVSHGLIGPREVSRLWDRHVLNCAVVGEFVADGAVVIDVGSGAGLPGIALAIARPDLTVYLVEPMLRRSNWLVSAVSELGLADVAVRRARAEELHGRLTGGVVTARAVAGIGTLAGWCRPLVGPVGELLAIKGDAAAEELRRDRDVLRRLRVTTASVGRCGVGLLDPPTTVIRVRFAAAARPRRYK